MITISQIRACLDQAAPWPAFCQAVYAARDAGPKANPHLAPADQLAVALQAADEALEGLAVELSDEGPEAKANRDTTS